MGLLDVPGTTLPNVTAAMQNPETALSGATLALVQGATVPASMIEIPAPPILTGGNINTARPTLFGGPYPGPVKWKSQLGRPTYFDASKGDTWQAISVTPLPWAPTTPSGLHLWVNPMLATKTGGATAANGDAVASIVAAGSAGVAFTQATGANQPLLTTTGLGGGPGLTFDGTNDNLISSAYATYDSRGTVTYAIIGNGLASVSGSARFIWDRSGGAPTLSGAFYRSSANAWTYTRGTTGTGSASNNSVHLVKVVNDTSATNNTTVYVDGSVVVAAYNSGNRYTSTAMVLGSRADSLNFNQGAIGDVIEYDAPLSGGDETSLLAWFHTRYPSLP